MSNLPKKVGIYIFEIISGNPERIGEKYVGQAMHNARERERFHWCKLKRKKHSNKKLQNYYNKYGVDSLKYTFLFSSPRNELNFWEKFFVKCFDSYEGKGFNLTAGGTEAINLYKPCIFKNIVTGEIINSKSRKHFASDYGFAHSSVNELVNGGMYYLGDWIYLPNENKIKKHKIISPEGKEYEIYDGKIKEFCDIRQLNYCGISQMLLGRVQFSNGWHRPNSKRKEDKDNKSVKIFKIINPNGEIIESINLKKFAQNNNLSADCLYHLLGGKIKSHRGWIKYKEVTNG